MSRHNVLQQNEKDEKLLVKRIRNVWMRQIVSSIFFCDVVFDETMARWRRNVQVYIFICREKLKIFQQILLDSSRLFENHFKTQLRTRFWAFSSAGSEHLPYKQRVGGSNPSTPTTRFLVLICSLFGRLAQLVQSICLTSRGSAVRIRQRPL